MEEIWKVALSSVAKSGPGWMVFLICLKFAGPHIVRWVDALIQIIKEAVAERTKYLQELVTEMRSLRGELHSHGLEDEKRTGRLIQVIAKVETEEEEEDND